MQLFPCPACKRLAVLPPLVSLAAPIRCPHCSEQGILGELVESELGYWEVLDAPKAFESSQPQSENSFEPAPLELEVPELAMPDMAELDGSVPKPAPAPAASDSSEWPAFQPRSRSDLDRQRRKKRSPIWTILQMALGGLAAFPIAQLILWHGMGKDIFETGPIVAQYVPWIVPEQFRPSIAYDLNSPLLPPPSPAPVRGESGFKQFDEVLPLTPSKTEEPPLETSLQSDEQPETTGGVEAIDGTDEPAPTADPLPEASSSDTNQTTFETEPVAMSTQPAAERLAEEQLRTAIELSHDSLQAWITHRSSPAANLKQLAQQIYTDLVNLPEHLSRLPSDSSNQRKAAESMHTVSSLIEVQGDIQDVVRQGSQFWLNTQSGSQSQFQLATIVEVAAAEEEPEGWRVVATRETQLLPRSLAPPPYGIHIPKRLAASLAAGQRLLLLGVVLPPESPSESENPAPPRSTFEACYLYEL